jgi:hypothetical protein
VDKKNIVIDAECVKAAGELKTETATRDFTEGSTGRCELTSGWINRRAVLKRLTDWLASH